MSSKPPNHGGDTVAERVLEFYKTLPFNVTASPVSMAAAVREFDSLAEYPPLERLIARQTRVLDVGCGGGWLSNSIAYHRKASVLGIDFNPVAVGFASSVASILGSRARFLQADLFEFLPEQPFDVVVSLGVLHHTRDCLHAVSHLCRTAVRTGGFIFVGLYHSYGRRPFLQHFERLRLAGAAEREQLAEFARLIGSQAIDETHLLSWFRDQVQHPHETQHSLAELAEVMAEAKFEILASSINRYEPISSPAPLFRHELQLELEARQRLADGHYYPGFFCTLARRKD